VANTRHTHCSAVDGINLPKVLDIFYCRMQTLDLSWNELFTLVCLVERMEGGGLPGTNFPQMRAEFLQLKEKYQIRGTVDEAIALIRTVWASKKIEPDTGI